MYSIIAGTGADPPARRAGCFLRGRDCRQQQLLLDITICRHGGGGRMPSSSGTLLAVRMLNVREKAPYSVRAQHAPSRANAARFYPAQAHRRIFE